MSCCASKTWCGLQTNPVTVLGRIEINGALITQAAIASVNYAVTETSASGVVRAEGSLVVADVIFDTPVVDGLWDLDDIGYNFKYLIDRTAFPNIASYTIEVAFTPIDGSPVYTETWNYDTTPRPKKTASDV